MTELKSGESDMYDDPLCDLIGEAMSEPSKEEQMLEFALLGFRTMTPDMQKAFLTAALDEYVKLARAGKVDVFIADQILFRAQWVASYAGLPQPGKLKMVVNNALPA